MNRPKNGPQARVLTQFGILSGLRRIFETNASVALTSRDGVFESETLGAETYNQEKIVPNPPQAQDKTRFYQSSGRPLYQLSSPVGLNFAARI